MSRGRVKLPGADLASAGAASLRGAAMAEEIVERARQDYLDALPIAAAVICVGAAGDPHVDMANEQFRQITDWTGHQGRWAAQVPLLAKGPIGAALADFLNGANKARQFETHDGVEVGGRHLTVRLSRLKPATAAAGRCLISLIDKTAQIETEKSLRAGMVNDSLTGLPNRQAFNEQIEAILAAPDFVDGAYAVVAIDMVRFSRVNECVGSTAGDELLITFARRLFAALRAGDVLARTGGDEFGILMRLRNGLDDALQLAGRISAILTAPFRLSDLEIRVDCSIGIALLSSSVELPEEVLRNAQFALKRSKQSGLTEIYEPTQASAARRRFSIETALRHAIENDELTLSFQPQIDLASGRVAAFEALARWQHEERGAVAPDEFIPVAEESGLILALGRWAIDTAARTLSEWDRATGQTLPLRVAVNVSPIQIARDDVSGAVEAALRERRLDGGRLTLELTETAIVQDPARAKQVLEALKALDVKIAMDDFGTGYSSLASLQRLPIDVLKIDRSFVTGMIGDKDSTAIVRAILLLAQALGLATTAEGVESRELAAALKKLSCGQAQGFYFAEALPADAALAYWAERNAAAT